MIDDVTVTLIAAIPLHDGDDTVLLVGRDSSDGLWGWFAADANVELGLRLTRSAGTVLTAGMGDTGARSPVEVDEFANAARRWAALRLLRYAGSVLGGTLAIVGGDTRFASVLREAAAGLGMKSRWVAGSEGLRDDTQAYASVVTIERSPILPLVVASVMTGGHVALAAPVGSTEVDLYADVHRRDVRLVGVPPLASLSCYSGGRLVVSGV